MRAMKRIGTPLTLMAVWLLAPPTAGSAAPWREEPAIAALFQQAGVEGTFVLLDERSGGLHGFNRLRAEQRWLPASTFKIANALIGLSVGAVKDVDELIPYTADPNPFMREWLQPMGLRGAMTVSNVPLYQELARRVGLQRMRESIMRLGYGNQQIGSDVTTFWLRGPLAISAVEQTRFLSALAHQSLPFPRRAQQQVAATSHFPSLAEHSSRWPQSPGLTQAPAWAGGWAGCNGAKRSLPLPSTSP